LDQFSHLSFKIRRFSSFKIDLYYIKSLELISKVSGLDFKGILSSSLKLGGGTYKKHSNVKVKVSLRYESHTSE